MHQNFLIISTICDWQKKIRLDSFFKLEGIILEGLQTLSTELVKENKKYSGVSKVSLSHGDRQRADMLPGEIKDLDKVIKAITDAHTQDIGLNITSIRGAFFSCMKQLLDKKIIPADSVQPYLKHIFRDYIDRGDMPKELIALLPNGVIENHSKTAQRKQHRQ